MDLIKGISEKMQETAARNTFDDFTSLEFKLVETKKGIELEIQSLVSGDLKAIISKLGTDEPLTQKEKELIELWMVGDAEGYARLEKQLNAWQEEFARLREVIQEYESREESLADLVNAHGVMEDVIRVTANIAHFLEDKERISRFSMALENLSRDERGIIKEIMKSKLEW